MTAIVEEIQRATFSAMGNTVHIVVVDGDNSHLEVAQRRIDELESRWSRFIPTSDIARLNSAHSRTVEVAPETISLLQYMLGAYQVTSGLFDPTRLPALIEAGYSRSLVSERLTILPSGVTWSHGLDELSIDTDSRCVALPPGVTIDAGGIGKGYAADIVANEILAAGASGVLVNIGGDLRCLGVGDREGVWDIAIASCRGTGEIDRVRLDSGSVATSSIHAKTFFQEGELNSHLIDPRMNRALTPITAAVVQATVIARDCVWAEAMTKALILDDPRSGMALIDDLELAAMIVLGDGSTHHTSNWARFQG